MPRPLPRRRSLRLDGYDYKQAGAYFVTICTHGREFLLGAAAGGDIVLTDSGRIVQACWDDIPQHFPHADVDAVVVMPNHVHGILVIGDVGARHGVPLRSSVRQGFAKPISGTLATIVRSFKSAATKRINELRRTPGAPVWQRNYYEHVIRNDAALVRIRDYIAANPAKWPEDRENPQAPCKQSKGSSEPWEI
ncbi:MAG: transposase [Alphaproteobacteria bacterium]|nr:transposase [Alphaproteobacteria bacterium]